MFDYIESAEFASILGLASGSKLFVDIVESRNFSFTASELLERISFLMSCPRDEDKEHPHDLAIAVYLLLLKRHFSDGFFWTRKVLRENL